jgi:predicted ATPase/class 3 adenylate cyclase
MSPPASALAAILFTDIEGSSRLWEQEPARMSESLAEHDRLARGVVAEHRGEVVKMVGDGVYAVFPEAADALACALALQQALSGLEARGFLPLKVRCGLHVGTVERRDADVFGSAVNRCARIMGAAHGGQVLASQSVYDAVHARLPAGVALRDLGAVRLRDLASAERLFQLVHADLRDAFPALRSLEATPNNLPQQGTSFIGRERELAEASALLARTRLLTLLGMGGMGKTRLSLQIAADVMDQYPDGVWFIDLAPVRDRELVVGEVAQVLGIAEEPGRPLLQTLCAHVRSRQLLVILDNCEHLVGACAAVAHALLRGGPQVKLIATTREALRVPGEQTYAVAPLPLPDRKSGYAGLSRSEAVQLFIERVRLQKPGFELTPDDAPFIAELCQRLEGIPLAIELAAARMQTLSVAEINRRLKDRYKLLTGGSRVLLERQQTLRALVGWSYDLLQENERIFFDRLSVFVGGFDLAAAEVVCSAEPLAPEDILDLLSSLVEKSLVMVEERDGETRYRLLETLCDYGRERLIKRDDVAATAERHCNHFLSQAKIARRELQGPRQAEWTRRLEDELDNIRAAIALTLDGRGDPILAVKFAVALQGFWILRGYATEGRSVVRAALARAEVQAMPVGHAHALYVGAALAECQSDIAEAGRMLEECLALRRTMRNEVEIAATLSTLSLVHLRGGDVARARACEEEAVPLFRAAGDRIGEAIGLLHLGDIARTAGEDEEARGHLEACLVLARGIGHAEVESECERILGELALDEGDSAGARSRFLRALAVSRDAADKRSEALALSWLGRVELAAGLGDLAEAHLRAALGAFQAFRMHGEALAALEDYAALLERRGEAAEAARLCGTIEASRTSMTLPRPPRAVMRWSALLDALTAALGDGHEAALAAGADVLLDDVLDRVLAAEAETDAVEEAA